MWPRTSLAKAHAKPVHHLTRCGHCQAGGGTEFAVAGRRIPTGAYERPEIEEEFGLSAGLELGGQTVEAGTDDGFGPLPLKKLHRFGHGCQRGGELISGGNRIEGDDFSRPALLAARRLPGIAEVALEGGEEKGAEFAEKGFGRGEEILTNDDPGEEVLSEVFSVFSAETAAPGEGVEGPPIESAEIFQRGAAAFRPPAVTRREHHTPAGGGKRRSRSAVRHEWGGCGLP